MLAEELSTELWRLPADERVAMLILSCVELDPNALGAVLNIIGVTSEMGKKLGLHQRGILAENLRLAAHKLEQDRLPRTTFENGEVRRAIV